MDGDELRWRPPSILLIPLIICGAFIFYVDIFQLQPFNISPGSVAVPQPRFMGSLDSTNGFLIKTNGCRIPDMDPFDSSIKKYIFKEKRIVCNNGTPPLLDSNLTHIYLLKSSLPAYDLSDISALKCCYSAFHRQTPHDNEGDNKIKFNKKCIPFDESSRITDEFVRVICSHNGSEIYKDFFAFIPDYRAKQPLIDQPESLNVLVLGVDAVSRLNLHRQMPKTIKILTELNAVELLGYNKVGDNTFPNLIPVLTGYTQEELVKICWPSKNSKFDRCPFIWKNFSEAGYTTAFGEDAAWMGIFNYAKRGFKIPPTDYFWGPYNFIAERQIGNQHKMNAYLCVGSKMVYTSLLEYIERFVRTMHDNNSSYFGFFWGASLSHDYLNLPKLGDENYADFLNTLQSDGLLNKTVLVFMSDHGIRWGDIRTTYQGRMEERMPFLYVSLPETYRNVYYQTYINLRRNAKRLTTPFDLHETLKDLLAPDSLTQENLNVRILNQQQTTQRGYSLFEPIPTNRSCEEAGIASHWCTCQQSYSVDKNDSVVRDAAEFTVRYINDQLKGYAACANLSLAEILNARRHANGEHVLVGKKFSHDYTIAFRTRPGDGVFEVTVRQHLTKNSNSSHFMVTGTISRINLYGNQSLCITDFHLKLYCYCQTYLYF